MAALVRQARRALVRRRIPAIEGDFEQYREHPAECDKVLTQHVSRIHTEYTRGR